jgi:hypothetical protein
MVFDITSNFVLNSLLSNVPTVLHWYDFKNNESLKRTFARGLRAENRQNMVIQEFMILFLAMHRRLFQLELADK